MLDIVSRLKKAPSSVCLIVSSCPRLRASSSSSSSSSRSPANLKDVSPVERVRRGQGIPEDVAAAAAAAGGGAAVGVDGGNGGDAVAVRGRGGAADDAVAVLRSPVRVVVVAAAAAAAGQAVAEGQALYGVGRVGGGRTDHHVGLCRVVRRGRGGGDDEHVALGLEVVRVAALMLGGGVKVDRGGGGGHGGIRGTRPKGGGRHGAVRPLRGVAALLLIAASAAAPPPLVGGRAPAVLGRGRARVPPQVQPLG